MCGALCCVSPLCCVYCVALSCVYQFCSFNNRLLQMQLLQEGGTAGLHFTPSFVRSPPASFCVSRVFLHLSVFCLLLPLLLSFHSLFFLVISLFFLLLLSSFFVFFCVILSLCPASVSLRCVPRPHLQSRFCLPLTLCVLSSVSSLSLFIFERSPVSSFCLFLLLYVTCASLYY